MVRDMAIPLREDGCLLSLSVLEGLPFEVTTENSRQKLTPELREKMDLGAFVTLPLKTRNRTHGTLLVDKRFSCEPVTRNCLKILTIFADHAALAIENSGLYDKTVHLSRTDWLTGLWNARYFDRVFREKTSVASAGGGRLSFLLIDIDRFKHYNDSLGHYEGDRAIRKVSEIIKENSRKCDTVSRYGGEEFCVIMNDIEKSEAFAIAERIRDKIAGAFSSGPLPSDLKLTVSQGLSHLPTDGYTTTTLFKKADKALYTAKSAGKNTTCVYQPDMAAS
jgi:diguanylate cyclase (GGDEF)-like protein